MTQFPTLTHTFFSNRKDFARSEGNQNDSSAEHSENGSRADCASSLSQAVNNHLNIERASFHTPGHKNRVLGTSSTPLSLQSDLTELPGLDDLTRPTGSLRQLELRASSIWNASDSLISVNGASSLITAAICALATGKNKILVPRNAHRSVVHGLILSGLNPIWYEPDWNDEWEIYTNVSSHCIAELMQTIEIEDVAGLVLVSPTYAGTVTDLAAIVQLCKHNAMPLIVDEAHGAHFLSGAYPLSAINQGADIVIHSLHKTVSGLTQTGVLHLSSNAQAWINVEQIRNQLNVLQSSSPSYLLMQSIDLALAHLETRREARLGAIRNLSEVLKTAVSSLSNFEVFTASDELDPMHIVISCRQLTGQQLYERCAEQGVFAETVLGKGVLFLLGVGSNAQDVEILLETLNAIDAELPEYRQDRRMSELRTSAPKPMEQVMNPRQAFLMPSDVVPLRQAIGMVSAECIAPCPPGIPVCVPGQKIQSEVENLTAITSIRVVRGPKVSQ